MMDNIKERPRTVTEAVDLLTNSINSEERELIRNSEEPNCHFGIGMSIRNNWGLWERNNPIVLDAIKNYKIAHADDISGLILAWTFALIKGEFFEPIRY